MCIWPKHLTQQTPDAHLILPNAAISYYSFPALAVRPFNTPSSFLPQDFYTCSFYSWDFSSLFLWLLII